MRAEARLEKWENRVKDVLVARECIKLQQVYFHDIVIRVLSTLMSNPAVYSELNQMKDVQEAPNLTALQTKSCRASYSVLLYFLFVVIVKTEL